MLAGALLGLKAGGAAVGWGFPLQEPIVVAALALVLFGGGLALAGVIAFASARPRGWNAVGGWTVAALVAALALTLVSWRITYSRLEGRELAVILDETVEVLAGPGENNAALFTIHEGTTIEIRAERGNWYQASLPNGLNGWLPKDAAGRV